METSTMEINNERCPLCPEEQAPLVARLDTWLMCDICEIWYHNSCLGLTAEECDRFDQYHCARCESAHGPSTYKKLQRKSSREHIKLNYADLDNGLAADEHVWGKILASKRFLSDTFPRKCGDEVTIAWVYETGMRQPFIVESPEGLDMRMPDPSLSVRDVSALVGGNTPVDVIDVATQQELSGWTLSSWAAFFHDPARSKIRNVISLEMSGTELARQIVRPRIVRELDWADHMWPPELKKTEYPKVQLYCLMSVKDSYTDFHIDFGGTSVFYHILSGAKTFYFIPPSEKNLKKYERWNNSFNQAGTFFADEVKDCYRVELKARNTMIIPTGWIHAVYTMEDSMVIGGNFLHGLNIGGQLRIYEIEQLTNVPLKFRFPYYERMCWYAGEKYAEKLRVDPTSLPKFEIEGISALANFLAQQAAKCERDSGSTSEERKWIRSNIPSTLKDPAKLAGTLKRRVRRVLEDAAAPAPPPQVMAEVTPPAPPAEEARPHKVKLKILPPGKISNGSPLPNPAVVTPRPDIEEPVRRPSVTKVTLKVRRDEEPRSDTYLPLPVPEVRPPTPPVIVVQKGTKLLLKVDKRKISATSSVSPPRPPPVQARSGHRSGSSSGSSASESGSSSSSSSSSGSSSSGSGSDSDEDGDRLGITSALAPGDFDYMEPPRNEDDADDFMLEDDALVDEDTLNGDDGGEYGAPKSKKGKAKRKKSDAGVGGAAVAGAKRKRPPVSAAAAKTAARVKMAKAMVAPSGARDESDSSDDGLGTKSIRARKEVQATAQQTEGEERKQVKGNVRQRLNKTLNRLQRKR